MVLCCIFLTHGTKKKHQKRRIVQSEFAEIVVKKLKNNGKWYLATDWEDYALQMLEVLSSCTQLRNTDPGGKFTKRPEMRAETKFEKRGKRLGT